MITINEKMSGKTEQQMPRTEPILKINFAIQVKIMLPLDNYLSFKLINFRFHFAAFRKSDIRHHILYLEVRAWNLVSRQYLNSHGDISDKNHNKPEKQNLNIMRTLNIWAYE